MAIVYLFLAVLLVLLNGFFVLAEFAAVKMRPSRFANWSIPVSAARWRRNMCQDNLDEYLSVCQVGITFTSIGLGFVAEPAVVRFVEPVLKLTGLFADDAEVTFLTAHAVAFAISYVGEATRIF